MDRNLIEQFIEVTGEPEAIAAQYLALADGNLETAISLRFESGTSTEPDPVVTEPEVRPPILPTREVLVPIESVCSASGTANNVFDRFRDFAVETQRQEEEMTRRVGGIKKVSTRKTKRLEDLFRPPCDILYLGSFLEAREHSKKLNRWLLVNVQNPQEFACQILNRDLWPNKLIREIVKDHFVLWQVLSNTSDGKRYIDFYNVTSYPYLAIVDPRTGECVRTFNHITVDSLSAGLNDMLSNHASPESASHDGTIVAKWSDSASSSKCESSSKVASHTSSGGSNENFEKNGSFDCKKRMREKATGSNASLISGNQNILSKRSRMDELDCKSRQHDNDCDNKKVPEVPKKVEMKSEDTDDQLTLRLCLRLPNGKKEGISMSPKHTIEDFLKKMEELGYPSSDHTYLIPFPKTNVGSLPSNLSLSETVLYPSNTVFITKV